jgi:hypothetical protein
MKQLLEFLKTTALGDVAWNIWASRNDATAQR